MIRILDSILRRFHNKRRFYGFFYFLFIRGLQGIEHGRNYGMVRTSGELRVLTIIKDHFKDAVIFDGGANTGEYAEAASAVGTVYAFEPSSFLYTQLLKTFERKEHVKPFPFALAAESREMTLHFDREGSPIASLVDLNYEHYRLHMNSEEQVQAITVDAFCQENKIDRITLLKLDIEGGEYAALKGAAGMIGKQAIDLIQFEMGWPNVDSKTFFKDFYLLLKDSYTLYRILSFGLVPVAGYFYEYEIFLGCNYLAVRKSLDLNLH